MTDIRISGRVLYRDGTPVEGARIRIWEMDRWQSGNPDDVIVDATTDSRGAFSGRGPKDSGGVQTFRYVVEMPGTNLRKVGKGPKRKSDLRVIRLDWENPNDVGPDDEVVTWSNWFRDHRTEIRPEDHFSPEDRDELQSAVVAAVTRGKKLKVVGSGHSHSSVAKPVAGNVLIDLEKLSGGLPRYSWIRHAVEDDIGRAAGDPDHSLSGEADVVRSYERVLAGTNLRELCQRVLAPTELGLLNIGPFDGQTIAGAVNTNTHGTGLRWPGFADMVRSVEMFVIVPKENGDEVELWVIEPSDGISDPGQFEEEAGDRHLVQDDDAFRSVVCGYGLFGVAYSYTLAVRDLYWLDEQHEPTTWGRLKSELQGGERDVREFLAAELDGDEPRRHQTKIFLHTAQCLRDGGISDETSVRIDTRTYPSDEFGGRDYPLKPAGHETLEWSEVTSLHESSGLHPIWPPMRKREPLTAAGKEIGKRLTKVKGTPSKMSVRLLDNRFFSEADRTEFQPFEGHNPNHHTAYYRAIRRGRDNDIEVDRKHRDSDAGRLDNTKPVAPPEPQDLGTSIEICVPLAETAHTIEAVMDYLASPTVDVVFLGPMGVRFTAASKHFLCPTHGRDSAFVEIVAALNPAHPDRWGEFLAVYEDAFDGLIDHLEAEIPGVRYHLGKYHDCDVDTFRDHYPETFDRWLEHYRMFNASGLLDCEIAVEDWGLGAAGGGSSRESMGRKLQELKDV